MSSETEEPSVLDVVSSDERCQPFLQEEFDAQRYSNTIIESQQVAQALEHIAASVSLLDRDLNHQVVSHHEDLLTQATGIEKLEGVLQMVQTRIESLQAGVQRIRVKISEPHSKIMARTTQLARLQTVCELLRRLIRVLYLRKRLRAQLQGGVRELTKAAQSLSELDYLSQGVDLSGIEVLDSDWAWVSEARNRVISQAETMLSDGLEQQNTSSMGTALQVFHHLSILQRTVQTRLQAVLDRLQCDIDAALDSNSFMSAASFDASARNVGSRASLPSVGSSAAWRAVLWTRLDKVLDMFYSACHQVYQLYKMLAKKRDSISHVCFIEELQKHGQSRLMEDFWSRATQLLHRQLSSASSKCSPMKQALEGEYPKLLRLVKTLWSRIQQMHSVSDASSSAVLAASFPHITFLESSESCIEAERQLRDSISSFQNAYLSRSLSQLLDHINLSFPSGSKDPPATKDLTNLIKTISSELAVASGDTNLVHLVASNVRKALQCYKGKCQQLASTSAESTQIAGPPNRQQLCHIGIANSLYALHRGVREVIHNITGVQPQDVPDIFEEIDVLCKMEQEFITRLLSVIKETIEAILASMHEEEWTGAASAGVNAQCSGYISELKNFIARVAEEHMKPFENKEFSKAQLVTVSIHVLEVFIRHASLIRPLEEGGRMRLAADMAQVELAVAPFCSRAADLGRSYRLLRAFRPLLVCSIVDIGSSTALGDTLPYSLVLDYLFSHAPQELRSPHVVAGWSQLEYSRWIGVHTESEHLEFIKVTIESYVKSARSRGVRQFAPVYTTMLSLLTAATDRSPSSSA